MNMKTLLGTAAGLMVATGAYAADLPGEAAPAAVDYVKVCDAFGAGFFYIPGTETCLDISGRIRVKAQYNNSPYSFRNGTVLNGANPATSGALKGNSDKVAFVTDANVHFDARTASDLGTVRSYFTIMLDGGNDVAIDDAFIQVGYLTVGKIGYYGDVFYGDTSAIFGLFDQSSTGAQVMVDNLGGGFYVGGAVQGGDFSTSNHKYNSSIWNEGNEATVAYSARVGIAKQSWGAFDLTGVYQSLAGTEDNVWALKGTLDLKLIDKLSARVVGTYTDYNYNNYAGVALALKYQATDALDVYAGIAGTFWDKGQTATNVPYTTYSSDKTAMVAQVGADYALTPDLIVTAEANYISKGGDMGPAGSPSYLGYTKDNWSGFLRLTRNW